MNDEAAREKLATALVVAAAMRGSYASTVLADALLPVVREIVGEELWSSYWATAGIPDVDSTRAVLSARAEALTKPPDGPVR